MGAQGNRLLDAHVYALNHDVAGARGVVAETPPPPPTVTAGEQRLYAQNLAMARAAQLKALGAWTDLLALLDGYSAQARTTGADAFTKNPAFVMFKAEALARTGRHAEAAEAIAGCGLDHYGCVVMRGVVAALAGDARRADHWFAEADRMAPSFPQAPEQWGRVLLARGQADAALAKAKLAHKRSPRYGDPLELWGEALLAKGEAKGAAGKFAEAAKFSPRWGRLHLKWGQALAKAGRTDEARAKWRAAAGMDLTAGERAELAGVSVKP